MSVFRSQKLREMAQHYPCVLCQRYGTTVPAHANMVRLGKGTGIKVPDFYIAYICQQHHDEIDGRIGKLTREEAQEKWTQAYLLTVALWFQEGIVKVK
jgi:hypothetical protein